MSFRVNVTLTPRLIMPSDTEPAAWVITNAASQGAAEKRPAFPMVSPWTSLK